MAWGFRASSFAATGSGAFPKSVSLGAAASAGDRIAVATLTRRSGTPPTTPTVSDDINAGNYTEDCFATFADGSFQCRASIYSHANSGSGTPSITATSASSVGGFMVAAYSGLLTSDPGADKTKVATGTAGTASSGASAATTAANEAVVGAFLDSGWNYTIGSGNIAAGQTFRGSHQNDASDYQGALMDQDSGSSGATPTAAMAASFPGSVTAATWAMLEAIYQLAGGGGGGPTVTYPMLERGFRGVSRGVSVGVG